MTEVFVRDTKWLAIRDRFTEEEILAIHAAVRSHRCCPPGAYVRLGEMDQNLAAKLRRAVLGDTINER